MRARMSAAICGSYRCGGSPRISPRSSGLRLLASATREPYRSLRTSRVFAPEEFRPRLVIADPPGINSVSYFALVKYHLRTGCSQDDVLNLALVRFVFDDIKGEVHELSGVFPFVTPQATKDVATAPIPGHPNESCAM